MTRNKLIAAVILVIFALGGYCFYFKQEQAIIRLSETEPVPPYQWIHKGEPIKIAMISVLSRQETYKYQRQIAQAIGEKLGRPVLFLHRRSYAEVIQLLAKGGADIALLSTGAYSVYGQKENFTLLAMQERHGLPYYQSYVIVNAASPVNSLWQLKGKSFAYTDPLSYSGYLAPNREITANGFDADSFFGSTYFTYSHDKSLRAVAGQFVDGAAIDSLAYDYLKKKHPSLVEKVKIIAVLPSAGTGPVVARSDFPYKQQVQDILLHLHEDPAISQALDELMIDRFILPRPDLYPSFGTMPSEGRW